MPEFTRPANPGHAFRDGKLYRFSRERIEVIRAWGPRAGAWRLTPEQGWRACRPWFSLEAMTRGLKARLASESASVRIAAECEKKLLETIPEPARRMAGRFGSNDWEALQFLNRCGEPAAELMESTPALAFALAVRRRLNAPGAPKSAEQARRALRLRQRVIAGLLGFPEREATVRVLRKIPRKAVDFWRIYHLRPALAGGKSLDWALHLPRLSAVVLRILCDPALLEMVSYGFLEELALRRGRDRQISEAGQLWLLWRFAQAAGRKLPRFRSVEQLEEAYTEERPHWMEEAVPPQERVEIPPPPVGGGEGIEPLACQEDLIREGAEMAHCAAGYAHQVAAGELYLYRLLSPERATFSIVRSGGLWKLGQIRGRANREVSLAAVDTVRYWLYLNGQDPCHPPGVFRDTGENAGQQDALWAPDENQLRLEFDWELEEAPF
jgi:hypothetical protein